MPENETIIPFDSVNVPWTGWPGTVAAGAPVHVPLTVVPVGIASGAPVRVDNAPAREHATVDAGAFPVFSSWTVHVDVAAVPCEHVNVVTVTLGVALVSENNGVRVTVTVVTAFSVVVSISVLGESDPEKKRVPKTNPAPTMIPTRRRAAPAA